MTPINVLITSAGGAAAINVIQALKSQTEVPVRLVAVDMDPLAPGLDLADSGHVVPRATDMNFIPTLLEICDAEDVDVAIPMLSAEVPILAAEREAFNDLGIFMLVSDEWTNRICADKRLTHEFFATNDFPTPETWTVDQIPDLRSLEYPVIIKPSTGSGSRHTYRADSADQLTALLPLVPSALVQQYVEGQEITVDVLADCRSKLLAAVQRERLRISDGKAVTARTIDDKKVDSYVSRMVRELRLVGPGNIQCIRTADRLYFIEVNARFAAGGLPLTVAAGANTPLMLLKLALGHRVQPASGYVTGLVMCRYLTELFILQNPDGGFRTAEGIGEDIR